MRIAKIFRNGRNRAVRLPRDFDFTGIDEVYVEKQGESLVLTPVRKSWISLMELPLADSDFMPDRPELLSEDRVKF